MPTVGVTMALTFEIPETVTGTIEEDQAGIPEGAAGRGRVRGDQLQFFKQDRPLWAAEPYDFDEVDHKDWLICERLTRGTWEATAVC